MVLIKQEVNVEIVEAGCCGSLIAMTRTQYEFLQRTHTPFYCINGHSLSYPVYKELEETKKKLAVAQEEVNRLATLRVQADQALKASEQERRRILRRASAGVCQKCHRTFANVQRHILTKHAEVQHGSDMG
mgnify:FL=1